MSLEHRPVSGWEELEAPGFLRNPHTLAVSAWRRYGCTVISALCWAAMPDGDDEGLQWHVSIRGAQGRPTRAELRRARRDFRLDGWEEDNHHPGLARHFWRPIDPARRVTCECKASELVVTESDGYRWTTPLVGECRGCEFERAMNRPCPLHAR